MYDFNFYMTRPKELPAEAYWRAIKNSVKLASHDVDDARAAEATLETLRGRYSQELTSLIGDANLKKYQAIRNRYRETVHSARVQQPSPDAEALAETERRTATKSKNELDKLGIDTRKIQAALRRYKQKASALAERDEADEVPAGARSAKRTKNQTFEPPYSGWGWARSWDESRQGLANPVHERWLDRDTGEIGNRTVVDINRAGDDAFSWIRYRTGVRQWYRMPSNGQVQVRMEWEGIDNPYSGTIEAEGPWHENSDVDVRQTVRGYARVIEPVLGPRIFTTVADWAFVAWRDYRDTNEDDHEWSRSRLDVGDRVSIDLFVLPGVIEEGEWVLVEAGIWTKNYVWSNDCAVRSEQTQRVILRELGLSSSGGE
jgi:hypothetical protein